nr:BTB/POZ domain-containing protein 17 [Danaus plexippus plexippus]
MSAMDYLTVDSASTSLVQSKDEENDNDDLEVDNSKSVLLKIATLYAEQLMSDLILEVAGVSYPAHRLILCASSEVFQIMLMNREWSEWRESRIVLQETPSAVAVFPHFLKYFYTGQIKISYTSVLPVLSLADKYNVKDLVNLCLEYMSQHIAQAARRGRLISWMQYTMAWPVLLHRFPSCAHIKLAMNSACVRFVKWNVEWVVEGELGELEDDSLLLLMDQSDLVLHNEMALYQLVVATNLFVFLRLQSTDVPEQDVKLHFDSLIVTVFSHVRFPMMCPNQLAKLLLCPLTQEHKEFFMERMAIAMSYQSGQYERIAEIQQSEAGRMLFTPRLYTEDIWGSVLAVDNFHSLPCYHTRTFIFSTRPTIADVTDKLTEWTVDLYPKGVWFKKSMLIMWAGNYDVPEVVLRTVRISITCQNVPERASHDPDVRVKIGILVWGVQNGVEHVASVVERVHRFSAQNRVLNIDGALDFDELNSPLYRPAAPTNTPKTGGQRCPKCSDNCEVSQKTHLLGPAADQLRIQVVIVPLTDFCDVSDTRG